MTPGPMAYHVVTSIEHTIPFEMSDISISAIHI